MVVVAACVVVVLVLRPVMMFPLVVLVRVGCVVCRWRQNPFIYSSTGSRGSCSSCSPSRCSSVLAVPSENGSRT